MTRIDHTGHGHPATPEGRRWCRTLRLGDRPAFAAFDADTTREGYIITAQDAQGRSLDLNGTAEGEVFQVWSTSDAVWVVRNLTHGVDHDWDCETHTLRRVARIELVLMQRSTYSPSGWAVATTREVHTIHADGTRTYAMEDGRW